MRYLGMWKGAILIISVLIVVDVSAQIAPRGVDSLVAFMPGLGQSVGQEPEFFPANIFGFPDPAARADIPTALPKHLCSIGLGGEIILGFANAELIDMPGPDFTIFENAFYFGGSSTPFAEPAKVAVSYDGESYREFPINFATLQGCAGITPTNGDRNPADPAVSGGDAFDLADVGFEAIRFIKITDMTRELSEDRNHRFWQPGLTGFDLDAVVGLHVRNLGARHDSLGTDPNAFRPHVYAAQGSMVIETPPALELTRGIFWMYATDGRFVATRNFSDRVSAFDMSALSEGVYHLLIIIDDRFYYDSFFYVES